MVAQKTPKKENRALFSSVTRDVLSDPSLRARKSRRIKQLGRLTEHDLKKRCTV